MKPAYPIALLSACLALTFASVFAAPSAAPASTATITGRVQNAGTGDRLLHARVSIVGTDLVTFTNDDGTFRLDKVPAGHATLRVFFTGLAQQEIPLDLTAGGNVEEDVELSAPGTSTTADEKTVKLSKFVVQSTKETNAGAIAVNEQRFSVAQKSVVSADQFGTIPDSNPGELMKWLPGVSVEYFANNIVGVSVRGLDAVNTEITFDGMPQASASTATLGTSSRDRNFEMLGSSAADIARVEIRKLRTPEDSANAIGGSINLVRRSAFEYSTRKISYNAFLTTDHESFGLGRRAGIRDTKLSGWRPNLALKVTDPVTKNFGYAITVSHNDVLARVHWSFPSVNFGNADQAAAAANRIATGKPLTTVSVYNPMATTEGLHDNPKQDITDGATVKLDWRPTHELKLSYSLSGGQYQERAGDDIRFTWSAGSQSSSITGGILDTPLGSPGTNDAGHVYGNIGGGSIRYDLREAWRNGTKDVVTNETEAEWRHGDWQVNAAGSISMSRHVFRDTHDGFFGSNTFNGSSLPLTGLGSGTASKQLITVNFIDNGTKFNAHTINAYAQTSTKDAAVGAPIDWQDLNNMTIGGAVSRPGLTYETVGALRLRAKRSFSLAGNPFAVRLGYDFDELYRNVQRYDAKLWNFVGADHIAGTQDDNAAQIAAVNVLPERDTYYDFPAVPRVSMRRLYQLYVAHPDWFQYRDADSYRFSTVEPYEVNERTHAPWLELSGGLFSNRLTYSGGVRYEKVDDTAVGNLDRGSQYVKNLGLVDQSFAGNLVRYVRKGAHSSGSNDGWFPSLELNYNIRENLILRAGYARTQASNRFTRSVIPSTSFDYNAVTSGPFSGIAIGSVNRPNTALKPWTANNYEAHLEYYTQQGGVFSVGGFVKDLRNVQVQQTELLDTPEKLAALDLDQGFLNFQATTWLNQGIGQINGEEAEMRQPLDVWLPTFARGFILTGSYNHNHLARFSYANGNISTDFQNFYENQVKVSLGYHRGRLDVNLGVIRYGRVYRQRDDIAASATNPGIRGDRFYPPYSAVDFNLEFRLTRWAKFFLSGRNINNPQKMRERVLTGAPSWSYFQIANNLGATYTTGITGTF